MRFALPQLRGDSRGRRTALAAPRSFVAGAIFLLLAVQVVCEGQLIDPDAQPDPKVVRTGVIGGMMLTGLWPKIAAMFEEETDYRVVVVTTGQRPVLDKAMRAGRLDLLTMHSGDITTTLVADGHGLNMRPWTRNDLAILGPPGDPAGIRGLDDGVEAFRRIADAEAAFVDSLGMGPREVGHNLWHKAGITPKGDWFIQDESTDHLDILRFAEEHNAYVIVGHHPVAVGKLPRGNMEIMVGHDPQMRRPYIVMEANPETVPDANYEGARALSDFLLSEEVQTFLTGFETNGDGGGSFFHPVWIPDQ